MAEPRKQIPLRLPITMAEAVDTYRGKTSREQWIRDAIEQRLDNEPQAFSGGLFRGRLRAKVN